MTEDKTTEQILKTEDVSQDPQEEEGLHADAEADPTKSEDTTASEQEVPVDGLVSQKEHDALNTRYLRLMADFDNYKRRVTGEKQDLVQYSNMELVKQMLPVLDAFELALQAVPEDADKNLLAFNEGMEKIHKQLIDTLGKAGLEAIEADCAPYDPNYHEAIMLVEDDTVPPNTITDVIRTGYQFKDKVIRPTVCRVSQG